MHQNIKNKHYRKLDSKLFNQKYYDFMLYKGETACNGNLNLDDMVIADFSDFIIEDGKLYSPIQWSGSTNSGVVMKDIGMTGVDNGFIVFDKDKVSNEEFLKIFFRTIYKIEPDDTRLFLSPIVSNTKLYSYDSEIVITSGGTKYLSLKGGFYQGFFKLFGFDYQVLPDRINNDIVLHFEIRPRSDYQIADNAVNNTHDGNDGIFFFMGTRAENKFWELYSGDYIPPVVEESETESDYFCDDFYDNSINNEPESGCVSCCTYTSEDEFIGEDASVDGDFTDSACHSLSQHGYYEILTDNKFMFFDRTETGFTVDNWIEGAKVKFEGIKTHRNINYFPWLNHTDTGYTIEKIDELIENIDELEGKSQEEIDKAKSYDILKDVKNNVFALRVRPDGAIGYRYGILDCDNENHYSVLEEYSKPGMVKMDEWNSINVRFAVVHPTNDKCDTRKRKMRIMIYVNGFLKFISKELDTISFRELDDVYQKQEGVPYNISLGGGAIGLLETIMPKYYDISKYILPIEKDFCGTFIGDIRSFKMYLGFIDYCAIKNYLS